MTSEPAGVPQSFWSQFLIWASRVGLAGKLAVALAVAAIGAGFATFGALTAPPPLGHDPNTLSLLLTLGLALLLLLGALLAPRHLGPLVGGGGGLPRPPP